ncbi:MAG: hypothetical protein P8I03_04445 [Thalassotalea sp.]|nr:hypothetical protein [Thalassotalea sp.]
MPDGTEGNLKVPSQIFRWFEKMKNNYENSVQSVLSKFEEQSKNQQDRIDNANNEHINTLKTNHNSQIEQHQNNLNQLHEDIAFYKQQITQQQHTIEQLNSRYDAVMVCLIKERKTESTDIKNIFESEEFFDKKDSTLLKTDFNPSIDEINEEVSVDDYKEQILNQEQTQPDTKLSLDPPLSDANLSQLFSEAMELRASGKPTEAFQIFKQAAIFQHAQSMGAMGRAYFLGEGTEENPKLGLMWLIKAAKLNLPQAVNRVEHFKTNDPELYQLAINLIEQE